MNATLSARVPPHDIEAEQAVLGALLTEPGLLTVLGELLPSPEAFYVRFHQRIYAAILALGEAGKPIDPVTVSEALTRSGDLEASFGKSYVFELAERSVSAAYAEEYAKKVAEKWGLRRLIKAAGEIVVMAHQAKLPASAILDLAGQKVSEVWALARKHQGAARPMRELVSTALQEVLERKLHQDDEDDLPTGFKDLDALLGGLAPGSLVLLAARPAMGKTAFALNIALHLALKKGKGVGIYSMEMPARQLVLRTIASEAKVDLQRVRLGLLNEEEFKRLVDAAGRVYEAPIFIDDTPHLTLSELRAKARRLKAARDVALIVIDYLQLIQVPDEENRQQEIATISRGLKALARELEVPVLALSQLSRAVEARADKRPVLSDLRESGSLEQDADVVLFLYRDEYYNPRSEKVGVAEVIVGKNRNGPTGTVNLQFQAALARFRNLAV